VTPVDLGACLASVAREMQASVDLAAATDLIVEAAADLVGGPASFAAITLVYARRRLETVAATSDAATRGDQLQYELGEGPCMDAVWDHEQVVTPGLASDVRWPRWGPRVADELGVCSMLCTQLFTTKDQLGALNIYSTELSSVTSRRSPYCTGCPRS
jgi:GAF domain-containing protein